jgi:hypothetical protein
MLPGQKWSGTLFERFLLAGKYHGFVDKEDAVDERSRVLTATLFGAIAGGDWGWLYLTEGGRRIRDQIEQ